MTRLSQPSFFIWVYVSQNSPCNIVVSISKPYAYMVMSKSAIKILWDPTVPWDRWDCPWESTVPGVLSRLAITIPKSCLDVPKFPWDSGMSSGLHCPTRYITVPLSFLSQSPLGTLGCPQGFPCPTRYITVPLPFLSQSPLGTLGCPQGFPCPTRYITVPLSFPSQSPLGTSGRPWDFPVPPDTSLSHCPSRPKVPLGQWDVLRTPLSHQIHALNSTKRSQMPFRA